MDSGTDFQRLFLICSVLFYAVAPVKSQDGNTRYLTFPGHSLLPDLTSFSQSLYNGDKLTLRGVYAEGVFALPVVQQPADQADYVSRDRDSLTQFEEAAEFGNIGLLAHNDLSGSLFPRLRPDQKIYLVYGDGRVETFIIIGTQRFQALTPSSVNSKFRNLETSKMFSAQELFRRVYTGPRHLTLQTCISKNGNLSWGRLFILAVPVIELPSAFESHEFSRQ